MSVSTKAALLASGGLDSTTLAYWLASRDILYLPVFIDYGQHCAETELTTLRSVLPKGCSAVHVVSFSGMFPKCNSRMLKETDLWNEIISDDDLFVPYRNQLLLTVGAAVALSLGINVVYSAFIQANLAKAADCTDVFLSEFSSFTQRYGGVTHCYPFKDFSKASVAQIGVSLGVPIGETYSCLVGSRIACGVCPNCVDRAGALGALES